MFMFHTDHPTNHLHPFALSAQDAFQPFVSKYDINYSCFACFYISTTTSILSLFKDCELYHYNLPGFCRQNHDTLKTAIASWGPLTSMDHLLFSIYINIDDILCLYLSPLLPAKHGWFQFTRWYHGLHGTSSRLIFLLSLMYHVLDSSGCIKGRALF